MSFQEYLAQAKTGELSIDESWAQGRAGFGGLVAALLYQNMAAQISDDRPVRSLQISFVGPVAANETLVLESKILREGKSVTQVSGQALQQGQVQLSMLGAFGHGRSSGIAVPSEQRIFSELPLEQRSLAGLESIVPAFTRHFEFRYCTALPFQGSDDTYLRGFLRFAEPPEKIGIPELLAIIDAWPPTQLPMLKSFAPASSLSWSLEFVQPLPEFKPDEFCQYEAVIEHAQDGYAYTQAKIWNAKGELIALSKQTVVVFD